MLKHSYALLDDGVLPKGPNGIVAYLMTARLFPTAQLGQDSHARNKEQHCPDMDRRWIAKNLKEVGIDRQRKER